MAISAMIFIYTLAHFKYIFDMNKSKSIQRNSCKSLVYTCGKHFYYNVRNTGYQPGKESLCKSTNFHKKALQDNCNHTKNYLSKWVFKVIFV